MTAFPVNTFAYPHQPFPDAQVTGEQRRRARLRVACEVVAGRMDRDGARAVLAALGLDGP